MPSLYSVPGFKEAYETSVSTLNHARLAAFLDLPDTLLGEKVFLITQRSLSDLELCGNPVICGGEISNADIAAFFWRHSVRYSAGNGILARHFCCKLTERLGKVIKLASREAALDALREWIYIQQVDSFKGDGKGWPAASHIAMTLEWQMREFPHWDTCFRRSVLDTPLLIVNQMIRARTYATTDWTPAPPFADMRAEATQKLNEALHGGRN